MINFNNRGNCYTNENNGHSSTCNCYRNRCGCNPNHPCSRCCCQGPAGVRGPAGPAGANGSTIKGSYDTLDDLIRAHPTGSAGDAYIVDGELYVWDTALNNWRNVGSIIGPEGPEGPQGPPGTAILDSYDTIEELRAAHPTGNTGDAYLVDGVLYIWNAEINDWESAGDLRGPQGIPGTAILGSYDSIAELEAAHPTGNTGDAYLVDGSLYIWNAETNSWENVGDLRGPEGPEGPQGPPGTAILGSYDSIEDLRAAHPTGNTGDAYLIDGVLYIWNAETNSWESAGDLRGPQGIPGTAILGSYDSIDDLRAAHPTGNTGDAYMVDGSLYIWNAETNDWENAGDLRGPEGAAGADGEVATIAGYYDDYNDFIQEHPTGTESEMYIVEGILYTWDEENQEWRALGSLVGPEGPAGDAATSVTIIPFATQQAPHVSTNNAGRPTTVALLGFSYMSNAEIAVGIDTNDGSFNLGTDANANRQVAFSLPFDMKLNSIYITVGNYDEFILPPTGSLVFPYVQIYAAEAGTNSFFPIADAFAKPVQGIDPNSALAATMRFASKDGLDIGLRAGTRIAICGMMEITGDTLARSYYLYYTGGIGLSRWIE